MPNRPAARDEALAAVCELADPQTGRPSGQWAGWFVQVADEFGGFFNTPIGHPPLRLVGANDPKQAGVVSGEAKAWHVRGAHEPQRAVELLDRAQILRQELLSLRLISEKLVARARELVTKARQTTAYGPLVLFVFWPIWNVVELIP